MRYLVGAFVLVVALASCRATEPPSDPYGLAGVWEARIIGTDFREANPYSCSIDPRRPVSAGCVQDTTRVTLFTGTVEFLRPSPDGNATRYPLAAGGLISDHVKPTHPPGCSGLPVDCWTSQYPQSSVAFSSGGAHARVFMVLGLPRLELTLRDGAVGPIFPAKARNVWWATVVAHQRTIYDSTQYGVVDLRRR